MALRVLLADESVTIKKVIQLALQDFAVEVKAVPVGLDVLEVSKTFLPDLVFADILLQKRSGYDVCADLKKDAQTAAVPVVLMWSSFMELDQKQVDSCGADGKLEKPFEVEMLRKLVLQLVPRTRSQRLAHYLDFPATIAAPLKSEVAAKAPTLSNLPTKQADIPSIDLGLSDAGLSEVSNVSSSHKGNPSQTPLIPSRPPAELGALPDLQLEGESSAPPSRGPASSWNMESFEPIENPALSDSDDDGETESFQSLKLPQPEVHLATPATGKGGAIGDDRDLDGDDDADQWSNSSLDKYRMVPLLPEEIAVTSAEEQTEITPKRPKTKPAEPLLTLEDNGSGTDFDALISSESPFTAPEASPSYSVNTSALGEKYDPEPLSEFSLSESDSTASFEIDHTVSEPRPRPPLVRELLRETNFELSSSGINGQMESLIREKIEPSLERVIERVVAQLLPEIAERIIKRELERLLEDTAT